jgi:hypothetical protein
MTAPEPRLLPPEDPNCHGDCEVCNQRECGNYRSDEQACREAMYEKHPEI